MIEQEILIIGSGISGLGAAYALRKAGHRPLVLEKDDTYGGLVGNFTIAGGYRFDRFVHFSFANDERVNEIFRQSTGGEIIRHVPNPYNIYRRRWIKHPAQNNLFPLDEAEKRLIIDDFIKRPVVNDSSCVANYEQWLRLQYGDTFAERFPMAYTPKYWMTEAKDLETKWVGNRLYQPSLDEVLAGAKTAETPVTYYAKEMRYPAYGGFKQFIKMLAEDANIAYGKNVVAIDPTTKTATAADGTCFHYKRLISSMPLPLLIKALGNIVPQDVADECGKLRCTSGYQISVALKGESIPPYLWWYIYDNDILPARVYSPSLKSPDNVPAGCSSLQLEVYCERDAYTRNELLDGSVKPLVDMGLIREEDIVEIDIRFEPWANVIFDHNIYAARERVIGYVRSLDIEPIGRFGLWDYLWTDQALLTGLNVAK